MLAEVFSQHLGELVSRKRLTIGCPTVRSNGWSLGGQLTFVHVVRLRHLHLWDIPLLWHRRMLIHPEVLTRYVPLEQVTLW